MSMLGIPKDAQERKNAPVATGVLDYFPNALIEIAKISKKGNEQHNPGSPLHWDRAKSQDESDSLIRHFLERYKTDDDGCLHAAKMAWRALAFLEKLIEERSGSGEEATPDAPLLKEWTYTHIPHITQPSYTIYRQYGVQDDDF